MAGIPILAVARRMFAWCLSLFRKVRSRGTSIAAPAPTPQDDPDAEIRDVFLTELTDVIQALQSAFADWRAQPNDAEALKRMRRGFHTLKGSAPLVGAATLSECCRQLERLIQHFAERPPTPDMVRLVEYAIQILPACAAAIRSARPLPAQLRAIAVQAQRFVD